MLVLGRRGSRSGHACQGRHDRAFSAWPTVEGRLTRNKWERWFSLGLEGGTPGARAGRALRRREHRLVLDAAYEFHRCLERLAVSQRQEIAVIRDESVCVPGRETPRELERDLGGVVYPSRQDGVPPLRRGRRAAGWTARVAARPIQECGESLDT